MKPIRECPLCGYKEVDKIYSLNFINNEEINGLPNIYDIVICKNCELVYDDFDSSQKQFDNYYNKNSTYSSNHSIFYDNEYNKRYKQVFNFINKYLNSKQTKILEFGCGAGELLKIFHNNGYSNLLGIDQSNAFDKIKTDYNINFKNGNILSGKEINDTFDLIILNHVLEHVYNIKGAIKNIKNLLNKEGYLYIEVPDAKRYKKFYTSPLYHLHYEHILHFSKPAIINLADIYGFDIVSIEECIIKELQCPSFRVLLKNNLNGIDIKTSLKSYINDSIEDINNNKILKKLILSNEKVILWGIGSSTLQLFSLGLEKLNIVGIVDASTKKWGKTLLGHKIISPNEIKDEDATILILPFVYYNSINKQIKEMGIKNKIYSIAEQSRACSIIEYAYKKVA